MLAALHGRVIAADPDRTRIRLASRATAALFLGLGAMAALALPAGQPITVAMLAGVVGMLSAVSVQDSTTRERLVTTALVPVVAGLAVTLAATLSSRPLAADAVFVVVMGTATYVRRFGPRGTALGMLAFMGYFFALFLQASDQQVPWLLVGALVGAAAMASVRFVLLPDRPGSDLRRLMRAFHGRSAAVSAATAQWLDDEPPGRRSARRLERTVADLDQVALRIEQQLDDDHVARLVRDPDQLRRRLFDAELAAEHLVSAVQADGPALEPPDRMRLARVAEGLASVALTSAATRSTGRSTSTPVRIAQGATTAPGEGPAQHVASALARLAEQLDALADEVVHRRHVRDRADVPDGDTEDTEDGEDGEDTEEKKDGPDDGSDGRDQADESSEGLSLTTRSALQVSVAGALAIAAGQALSPQRWYWAVITAFVVFTNAPSRVATVRRAALRVGGTVLGVAAGLVVGSLLAGDTTVELVLIAALVFMAFYMVSLSQAATIFCFTIMLALLYSLLGTLTAGLLVLRLEETVIGAVIGGLVATLLLPRSGGHAIDEAAGTVLERVGALLEVVGADGGQDDVRGAAREVDRAFQGLRDHVRPAVLGLPGAQPRARREGMLLFTGLRYWSRVLAVAASAGGHEPLPPEELQAVRDKLAALSTWYATGAGPKVPATPEEQQEAAGRPDANLPRVALSRLDETVVALARGWAAATAPDPTAPDPNAPDRNAPDRNAPDCNAPDRSSSDLAG